MAYGCGSLPIFDATYMQVRRAPYDLCSLITAILDMLGDYRFG